MLAASSSASVASERVDLCVRSRHERRSLPRDPNARSSSVPRVECRNDDASAGCENRGCSSGAATSTLVVARNSSMSMLTSYWSSSGVESDASSMSVCPISWFRCASASSSQICERDRSSCADMPGRSRPPGPVHTPASIPLSVPRPGPGPGPLAAVVRDAHSVPRVLLLSHSDSSSHCALRVLRAGESVCAPRSACQPPAPSEALPRARLPRQPSARKPNSVVESAPPTGLRGGETPRSRDTESSRPSISSAQQMHTRRERVSNSNRV